MSKSNHDDLADALARLAGGDVAPSEHEPPAPVVPPVPPAPGVQRTVRTASVRPVAPRPAGAAAKAPPAVPVAPTVPPPVAPRPVRPAAPALVNPPPSPPVTPSNSPPPVIRAVAPAVRKARPAAPTVGPAKVQFPDTSPALDTDVDGGQSTGIAAQAAPTDQTEIIDDDDMMSIPAPEASVFQPKVKNVAQMRARAAAARNLELRRTLIPILLTCGVMLAVFASLKFVSGSDSMLAVAVPPWIPAVLGGFAVLFLVLAGVMMMSVKQQLDAQKK